MPYFALAAVVVALAPLAQGSPLSTSYEVRQERPIFSVAPLVADHHPHGSVNNSYMVVFKDDVSSQLIDNHFNFVQLAHSENPSLGNELAAGLRHVYDGHVKGYSGHFSVDTIDRIRRMPEVAFVEKDQIVRTQDEVPLAAALGTQKSAPWGLARISHRTKLTFRTFTLYEYEKRGGEGVDVYVIDTGINVGHKEFDGRASWGKTIPQNDVDEDGNGHGTHCAGTIASNAYGVAKAAHVIAVKVLGSNGSGTMSDVVAGVDFAAKAAKDKLEAAKKEFAATGKSSHKGSVANMSLGGGKSQILDIAVNKAVDNGMHFAVAAGNDNRDACSYSPAAAENAVTVAASTLGDLRAYFSNYGKCVDVFAPGLNILSTYIGSTTATTTMSGTSMASPHTAGILAYLLSLYGTETFNPKIKPDFVPSALVSGQSVMSPSFSHMYSVAHSVLPSWVSTFLPPPRLIEEVVAPIPEGPATITPKQLKAALLELATADALKDSATTPIPAGTPNLLIFNNATSS
ncbi:peptidase S8/S53 domain-containing protein [Cristinia sonorae]|uniref:Peptidase S8/S53 domain-containing protein n=1 Tax=Cristinia sonorae TaxID=1940300 RepID=A0A8K0XSK5_9AGAR|nr:peptidase S8/S53 domain-containing protein [Cristinia sonorae]